jgi:hypothetical protein
MTRPAPYLDDGDAATTTQPARRTHVTSHADSPPPQILQLQTLIQHLIDQHHRGFAQLAVQALSLNIALDIVNQLIEQYPVLTERHTTTN